MSFIYVKVVCTMKKSVSYLSLFLIAAFFVSCKSSKNAQHGKCDAYSFNSHKQTINTDLASAVKIEKKEIRPE